MVATVTEFEPVLTTTEPLEEIDVVMGTDGESIARELILDAVLEAVMARVEQKASYERKRKTWNKQRIVQKVSEIQEKRSKWGYQEPAIPIRAKLSQLFEQESQTPITYNVPLPLALRQCVTEIVNDQY